jgi:excisionase family DNA binding protein
MINVTEETLTLSVLATAKLLGISRGKCYQAIATGEIPNLRIGKRILVPRATLLAMLSAAGSSKTAKVA